MSKVSVPRRPFIPANIVLSSDPNSFSEFQPLYERALTTIFQHGFTFEEMSAIWRPFMSEKASALMTSVGKSSFDDGRIEELTALGMEAYNGIVPDFAGMFATLVSYLENRFPSSESTPPDLLCAIDLIKQLYALTYWARWPLNPTPFQAANQLAGIASVGVSVGMMATYLRQFQEGDFALMAASQRESERPKQRRNPKSEDSLQFTAWWENQVARGNTPTIAECEAWGKQKNLGREFIRNCRRERTKTNNDMRGPGNHSKVRSK